jgi:uncharacterized protein GlcG (DUF336 family)
MLLRRTGAVVAAAEAKANSGAIGISADTPDHDEQIAKAGAAVISQ